MTSAAPARPRAALPGGARWMVPLAVGLLAVVVKATVASPDAMTGLARTGVAAVALFGICGYGPARLLLGEGSAERLWLCVLPVGAACGTLTLTVLGLLHVPLVVSLPVTMAAGAGLAAVAVRRGAPAPSGSVRNALLPALAALVLAGVVCLPSLRAGFPTVQGQNGDAVIAVGTGKFLQEAPPTAIRPELGLDRVPLVWRSKLPIYYGLAAVAQLSGQEVETAFTGVIAVVLGLAMLGLYLLLREALRAPPLVAVAAMLVVGLDRIVVHLAVGPFYNQTWAVFAFLFVLWFGRRFLLEPDRRSAGLAVLFTALALFTYPLLLPLPAVFFAVLLWRHRHRRGWVRALRLPRPQSAVLAYGIVAALAVPVTLVLVRGIVEKIGPAVEALLPGGDLGPWSGGDVLPYLPFGWFVGVSMPDALAVPLVAAIVLAALHGLRQIPRDAALGLLVVIGGAVAGAMYIRLRGGGELFYFKALSFVGPLALMLAVVGVAALRPRWLAIGAVAVLAVVAADGARDEISRTYDQTPQFVLELRDWDKQIPTDQRIRLDVPPSGWQLWSMLFLPRHELNASNPLKGLFAAPQYGFTAELSLGMKRYPPPPDRVGPPVLENDGFVLYRLRPRFFGYQPDTASQRQQDGTDENSF